MLASKWFDLVLGVDIHIMLVPTPAGPPVPTPLPSPFIGMVFDPAGMAFAVAFGAATGGVSFTLVNSLPATNTGTGAIAIVPHAPVPGPFQKPPSNDATLLFGGLHVTFGGSNIVRLGDIALSCNDPIRMPTSLVVVIPVGSLVLVPRPPSPDLMGLVFAAGGKLTAKLLAKVAKAGKRLFKGLRAVQKGSKAFTKLSGKLAVKAGGKLGRARAAWNRTVCFLTGHPVDVATGRVVTDHLDVQFGGALPLRFERFYDSSLSWRETALGAGWSHALDQAVWPERGRVVYRTEDGREVEFSTLSLPDRVLRAGQSVYHRIERLTLRCLGPLRYEVKDAEGVVRSFAPAKRDARAAAPGAAPVASIVRKRTRDGKALKYSYDGRALLAQVTDDAGRRLVLAHDRRGRLVRVDAVGTDGTTTTPARFAYDAAGDLIKAGDAAGLDTRYEYVTHLLVKETNRNGLSFYFQYDGVGASARCIRTWGDGGIYDHAITYDAAGRRTLVENSLGQVTLYQMDEAAQVVSIKDALGNETRYAYDADTGARIEETDPTGAVTAYGYDQRGNCTRVVQPDGGKVELEFNPRNQPVRVRDQGGGEWQWDYDGRARLVGRIDPSNGRTQYHWKGARLVGVTDAAGRQTHLGYDRAGNATMVRTADGAESRWTYDGFGRSVTATDPLGNVQRRERDALGRVTRVLEPDGNLRELIYDAEGDLVHARDQQQDVRFAYRGMGRLASRTEAGTTVAFEYDTEEQLVAIRNEHGQVYRFELGPTGQTNVERGFDQIRRQYVRDRAGRVVKVIRPGGRVTEMAYDPAGRVVSVKHGDGTAEAYTYGPDGRLAQAKNDAASVTFERDALGRVQKELTGDDWVASEYDGLGMRAGLSSSRGLRQQNQRNAMGDVQMVQAWMGGRPGSITDDGAAGRVGASPAEAATWQARFQRDALGLELERTLPGGVAARWERDKLGRPLRHEIWSDGVARGSWRYTWDVNDRLRTVTDSLRGPARYDHDAVGSLAAAVYADGRVDLRLPDAVGNLFRTRERQDRKYGAAGQLLESREPDGRVVRYAYDAEGNLIRKTETAPPSDAPDGGSERVWAYQWNAAGMLARVVRPDGDTVAFTYDALGRRLSKTYRGRTTRWIWDGDVPLHEWVEQEAAAGPPAPAAAHADPSSLDELTARRRRDEQAARPAQGPPPAAGTPDSPITWLFEPESFAPLAKLVGGERHAIITDHLGTPRAMYDDAGREVWSASIDAYGDLRNIQGDRQACPFRWPGQYEDAETGLYYNRFRYYDPEAGEYASQDPMRTAGGLQVYGYVHDPTSWTDPLGLAARCGDPRVAREARWVRSRQGADGPGLPDHFRDHRSDIDVGTAREYDQSARETIRRGWRFEYRDRWSNRPRVGYWDPATGRFTATSQTRRTPIIHTHFTVAWEQLKKLPGFTST